LSRFSPDPKAKIGIQNEDAPAKGKFIESFSPDKPTFQIPIINGNHNTLGYMKHSIINVTRVTLIG
jgi:hypothetical protein